MGFAVLLIAPIFWPAVALVAAFLGLDPVAEQAYLLSPSLMISDEKLDDAVNGIRGRHLLEAKGKSRMVGAFRLLGPEGIDLEPLAHALQTAEASCTERLGRIPIHPVIVLQGLGNAEGSFQDFFRLMVDPTREEPEKVVAHELVHLHLLWALLPGLPVDCPRWFNEGMAEEMSWELASDSAGEFSNTLIPPGDIPSLDQLSYGFSQDGSCAEIQSLEAFRHFRNVFRDDGISEIIRGLRLARPFRSVFQLTFGSPLALFEAFHRNDVEGRCHPNALSLPILIKRLEWLVRWRSGPRTMNLLESISPMIGFENTTRLRDEASLIQAENCVRIGRFREAMGWLAPLARTGHSDAIAAQGRVRARAAEEESRVIFQLPRPSRQAGLGWFLAFGGSLGLMFVYTRLRQGVIVGLSRLWSADNGSALALRWITLLGTGFGAAWFLRLLVIGFIPYAGIGDLSDFSRIVLAEGLVVIAWLGLSWQFVRLDSKAESPTQPAVGTELPRIAVLLSISAWLPAIWAARSWAPSRIPLSELLTALTVNVSASGAFFFFFWRTAIRWQRFFPGRGKWPAAFAYALFRGGLGGDPGGWVFALLFGRTLAETMTTSGWLSVMALDLLCVVPHVVLAATWFPAQDPLGGLFISKQHSAWRWGVPIVIALWALGGEGRGRPKQPANQNPL